MNATSPGNGSRRDGARNRGLEMSLQSDTSTHRVLPSEPFRNLDAYIAQGGGRGLEAARAVEPVAVIEELAASGLRGRGGAGFPTGAKWRTIAEYASTILD